MRPIPSLSRKLVSASSAALATALLSHAPVAQAQSFQGTVNGPGAGSFSVSIGSGVTDISISGDSAVINWLPSDNAITGGPINFQTAGTTATFTRTDGSFDNYAVLNRIIPSGSTRSVQFNGNVVSNINVSGTDVPGGNIFFYSPGGIILGSTANFDVGSLALTTLDLEYDNTGNFGTAGTYNFNPFGSLTTNALVPGSEVRILPGATIDTTTSNSYVALVAPRIYNGGTITVNGSAALVAADSAEITFSPSGLFTITVDDGTSATGTVIENVGTITGPAALSVADTRRIYMVAVAKNDAITMAIGSGSQLGFAIAGAANIDGNTIILSGGNNLGLFSGSQTFVPSAGGTGQVSVIGGDADITSNFVARVNGGVNLGSNLARGLNFASNAGIIATGASSSLFANAGGVLNVVGNLSISGNRFSGMGPIVGNDVSILADSSGVANLNASVALNSEGFGAAASSPGSTGLSGTGGLATIQASNGGQITILGNAGINANGFGGGVQASSGAGGTGLGGSANILAAGTAGSSVAITGGVSVSAVGTGGAGLFCSTCLPTGGDGFGGLGTISAAGDHTITIGGFVNIEASGIGGDAQEGLAGSGTGGLIDVSGSNGGSLTFANTFADTIIAAEGVGGNATGFGQGGNGTGGIINVLVSGVGPDTTTFNGGVSVSAQGLGGSNPDVGSFASNGTGGEIYIGARDGHTLDFNGALTANAGALGGSGNAGVSFGTGGQVNLDAQTGGTITVAFGTGLLANGLGGGTAIPFPQSTSSGGTAEITLSSGGSIQLDGSLDIEAFGQGSNVEEEGPAGHGLGGTARISGTGGSVFSVAGATNLLATGIGGNALDTIFSLMQGGDGTGGTAAVDFNGGLATFGQNLTLNVAGLGGEGGAGDLTTTGGVGTGGLATLSAGTPSVLGNGGVISVIGQTQLNASGTGGEAFGAGTGIGGQANIYAYSGNVTLANVNITAFGLGANGVAFDSGGGLLGANGGAGSGGTVNILAGNALSGPSAISAGSVSVNATGTGGAGSNAIDPGQAGGGGGLGEGGTVLVAGSAGNGTLQTGGLQAIASGIGGLGGSGIEAAGGNGGEAAGGQIRTGLISGTDTGSLNLGSATYGSIAALANAAGGNGGAGDVNIAGAIGGTGGNATGGGARLVVEGGTVTINGLASWEANSLGGQGGSGASTGNGGNAAIGSTDPFAIAGSSAFVTSRSGQPSQRGNLVAQDLIFASSATEGTGLINGTQAKLGSAAQFIIKDSSVSATNISLFSLANNAANLAIVDPISLANSAVTVTGVFQLNSSTSTSLTLDQSTLAAGTVAIGAANWVLDPVVPATLGTLTGTTALTLSSGQNLVAHANLATQSTLALGALGAIDLGSISAVGLVEAIAGTTLSLDDVTAGALDLSATGLIDVGNVTVTDSITAESLANITTGNLVAGMGVPTGSNGDLNSVRLRSGGSIATGTIFAASNLGIVATNAISTGEATAYDMLWLGGGSVSTGGLNASNRVLIANASMEAIGQLAIGFDANLVFAATPVVPTSGPITINGPVSATSFSAATQGAFTSGAITVVASTTGSGSLLVNAGGVLTATDLTARNALALSASGSISTGALVSDLQGVSVNTLNGSIATGAITARNDVTLGASQALTVNGNIDARSVFGTAGANSSFGEIASNGAISLSALGTMDVERANAAADISLESIGNLVAGDLAAGGGTPTGMNGEFNSINLRSDGGITAGVLFAGSNLNVFANGDISTGQATAYDLLLLSGGSVSTTNLNASNRVLIANRSMEAIGQLANGFDANLVFASPVVATGGAISVGAVSAAAFTAATLAEFASQSITVLPSTTGSGNLLITADGALNADNLVAANRLNLVAGGALSTGSLRSDTQGVKVAALSGNATTGAITARNDVLISTPQSLSVGGPINARDVVLLAGADVSTGGVFAGASSANPVNPAQSTNPTGRVLIASNSLAAESFLRSASVDYAALLAASPIRTGGTVNVGAVSAGRFVSYSQGAMTGSAITTSALLDVETGGRVNITQRWISPLATIASADIRIIDNGSLTDAAGRPVLSGLHSTPTGSIRLVSIGGEQTLIGDGLIGTGYALSAAEFGLISTGDLVIGASSSTASSASMRIGNLALTAGGTVGQSIVAGPSGRILFATGNRNTQTMGGSIRITGNVTGSGFAGSNVLEFATGRFELDAATGSLSLTQTGTALGGTVEIAAANIHIASGSILERLAADPFYVGYVDDLNNAAAVSRPEGVLRALGLDLFPTGTLYIQNTGTVLDPAGFFADFALSEVTPPANASPASIALIVNGKWQTPAGVIGGIAARDLVVNSIDTLALYTASSAVNGCALNAASCTATQELLDPTPAITGQIAIVSTNVLGNTPQFTPDPASSVSVASDESAQATEEAQEEAEAAVAAAITSESASSPIAPPPQIIDSAPLQQKPPIDQPVAGSGNPSLIGSAVNENSAEGTAQ
ncbi:hypothetical protein [Novosphingobium sp. AAP83]|uniref:hypothetical protein n=1 Tax=Novosphingobium sp. AAP83 TaxID=1523425 RepID=UPI0006B8B8AA|nr:hypothetical protein [Novosphingobium sp. AAP83]